MTFTLTKDPLIKIFSLTNRFTSDRLATSPVLKGVYLKNKGEKLHAYATNLNMFIHVELDVTVNEDVDCIIDPKKITEFAQLLLPGDVQISVDQNSFSLSQGKTKGSFPIMTGSDFPLPPDLIDEPVEIQSDFLNKKLPFILFTASTDESRPVLSGVNFATQDNELLLVSTDGFRLSICKEPNKTHFESMIVPADFLRELLTIIEGKSTVLFTYSKKEKIVSFHSNGITMYSRLVDGDFPPFDKVVPQEKNTTVRVKREELLRNTKIIALFARESSNIVLYEIAQGGIKITTKKGVESENSAFVEAEVEGEVQKIAFNFKYVLDFLNHTKSEYIEFDVLRSDAPVVFKEKDNASFMHIIMPVRIQE